MADVTSDYIWLQFVFKSNIWALSGSCDSLNYEYLQIGGYLPKFTIISPKQSKNI